MVEEQSKNAAEEAKKLLETTKAKLIAERTDQINKLKEQHRQEMGKYINKISNKYIYTRDFGKESEMR